MHMGGDSRCLDLCVQALLGFSITTQRQAHPKGNCNMVLFYFFYLKKIFLHSFVGSMKFCMERCCTNAYCAVLIGVGLHEINTMEQLFMKLMRCELYISEDLYDTFNTMFHSATSVHHSHTFFTIFYYWIKKGHASTKEG
jgi:hypothetical protein